MSAGRKREVSRSDERSSFFNRGRTNFSLHKNHQILGCVFVYKGEWRLRYANISPIKGKEAIFNFVEVFYEQPLTIYF